MMAEFLRVTECRDRIYGGRLAAMVGVEIMRGTQVRGGNDKPQDCLDRS